MGARFFAIALAASSAQGGDPSSIITTIVGAPEVLSGPQCCLFDSPFLGISAAAGGGVLGYTANSESWLLSAGATISSLLPAPLPIGLQSDPSNASFSHCGKWLNAAFAEADGATVHGFFHQEWNCDYAHNLFTNKSIGYALSTDGGRTFAPSPLQVVAGANFSASQRRSQCGEGDHGVARLGDWLYLFFIEWDAPVSLHGGTSVGVARSRVSDGGRPGTWFKLHAGGWGSPGVGGDADALAGVPGTAVYALEALPGALMAVGVMFSGPLDVAYSAGDPPTSWAPARAGPLFHADYSSWDRTAASGELCAYPSLVGLASRISRTSTRERTFAPASWCGGRCRCLRGGARAPRRPWRSRRWRGGAPWRPRPPSSGPPPAR